METNYQNIEEVVPGRLMKYFMYYEKEIFGNNLKHVVDDSAREPISYVSRSFIMRIFGQKDYFICWNNEKIISEFLDKPVAAKRVLIHELRHRFQIIHSDYLISKKFVEKHRFYFQSDVVSLVSNKSEKHSSLWKKSCEFDANLIEWIYVQYQKKSKMSDDTLLISLITSNEKNILKILSRLK